MASGRFFEFNASQHAALDLLGLGALLVLPLARVPMLKVHSYPSRDHAAQKR